MSLWIWPNIWDLGIGIPKKSHPKAASALLTISGTARVPPVTKRLVILVYYLFNDDNSS